MKSLVIFALFAISQSLAQNIVREVMVGVTADDNRKCDMSAPAGTLAVKVSNKTYQ